MNIRLQRICLLTLIVGIFSLPSFAGNPDRTGEAGAYELLINGWARSSGMWSMNSSAVQGIEAMRINVGGLAFVEKTQFAFSYSLWMQGSDVSVIKGGFAQKFKEENVLGLSIMSLSFGEITTTTTSLPEGGIGTYRPTFLNIGVSYARTFSNSIHAGATVRLINEGVNNLNAFGIAFDAGIQYVTGIRDQIRFGVSIRNLGTPLRFSGDGLTFRGDAPEGDYQMTLSQRSEKLELPSLLNIGASYDFYLGPLVDPEEEKGKRDYRLTVVGNFTSNSVGKDHFGGGVEFSFKEIIMVRGGYRYEDGINNVETRTSSYTGFAAGATVDFPLSKKKKPTLAIDYSFRTTNPFKGTHSIGALFNL